MIASALGLILLSGLGGGGRAADLSAQEPIEVAVELGTKDGSHRFVPDTLRFETGKLYKLVLRNPSRAKHYFTALRFAAAVWTRKVETGDAEIKGAIREIEVLPNGKAEWFFVPVQAGEFDLQCTIEGHAEAGMVGRITVR
jgi:uncharacterized cupredoxin-like copper-binding protein